MASSSGSSSGSTSPITACARYSSLRTQLAPASQPTRTLALNTAAKFVGAGQIPYSADVAAETRSVRSAVARRRSRRGSAKERLKPVADIACRTKLAAGIRR